MHDDALTGTAREARAKVAPCRAEKKEGRTRQLHDGNGV
jgi:hypothetical protein